MTWCKARVVDKYNWSCPVCKKKVPIRYKSFLADFKCDLPSVIKGKIIINQASNSFQKLFENLKKCDQRDVELIYLCYSD